MKKEFNKKLDTFVDQCGSMQARAAENVGMAYIEQESRKRKRVDVDNDVINDKN